MTHWEEMGVVGFRVFTKVRKPLPHFVQLGSTWAQWTDKYPDIRVPVHLWEYIQFKQVPPLTATQTFSLPKDGEKWKRTSKNAAWKLSSWGCAQQKGVLMLHMSS